MMENNSFKSSIFGGFNRQDVVNYIEKSARESQELMDTLESEKKALQEERDALREQLARLQEQAEQLRADNEQLRQDLQTQTAAAADCQALREESETLRARLSAAEPLAQEYLQAKEHIGRFEIEARKRADELERQTRESLQQHLREVAAGYQQLRQVLEGTVQHVSGELRDVGVSLSQLPLAFNKLSTDLEALQESVDQARG